MKIKIEVLDHLKFRITSDTEIWDYFAFSYIEKQFNWATRRYYDGETVSHIADWVEGYIYDVYRGWAIYLYSVFEEYLDEDSKNILLQDTEDNLFEGLNKSYFYDDQWQDVNTLLQYKRGILQIYTSYGKTEIIMRLAEHCIRKGFKVLIVAGGSKAKDEIWYRIHDKCPDIELPNYYDENSNINIISPNGFCRSNYFNPEDNFFKTCDICFADEVELTVSESMWSVFRGLVNCKRFYGVGATAEADTGKRIDIRYKIQNVNSMNTKWVVDIFGMSIVYRKPDKYLININELSNIGLREIEFNLKNEMTIYQEATNTILLNEEFLCTIDNLLDRTKNLYIPINNLQFINTMCDRYDFHIVSITGDGYWSSEKGWIDLEMVKYLTSEGKVKLLLSTVSGFRATDFRGINNILLTLGVKASSVLQYIGRVARQEAFNIWYITPGGNWKLPVYTKTNQAQLRMIREYYELCYIKDYKYEI